MPRVAPTRDDIFSLRPDANNLLCLGDIQEPSSGAQSLGNPSRANVSVKGPWGHRVHSPGYEEHIREPLRGVQVRDGDQYDLSHERVWKH